jgi:hypothetical protein
VEKPTYSSKNRSKRKLTDEIINKIEFYLEENAQKRASGKSKQQKKKIDIYQALINQGYEISYPTVSITINLLLNKGAEAYIKAEYELGDVCEFDWGEIKLFINGILKKVQMAVFTSAKGNYRYARLFMKQNTECFQESHALFFEHIDSVYRTMVYDNMKVAVKNFVGISEKEPTDALLKMSIYYGFKFRLCNIRSGNEKGHVERSVEIVRRKAFCDKDEFLTLEEANAHLLEVCTKLNKLPQKDREMQSPVEILKAELPYMLPKVPKLDTARTSEPRVDKYSTIVIDTCHYSVPDMYVGKRVFLKVYSDKISCFYENMKIAEHSRSNGFNEWKIKIEHYLNTLKKKPGALAASTALHQADPRLQQIYTLYYIRKEKEFIDLLQFVGEKGIDTICQAIDLLSQVNPTDISTEKIKTICNRNEYPDLPDNNRLVLNIISPSDDLLKTYSELLPASTIKFDDEVAIV